MKIVFAITFSLLTLFSSNTQAQTPAPTDAEVYLISPLDGETVTSPVIVKFGLHGMGVAPAGMDKASAYANTRDQRLHKKNLKKTTESAQDYQDKALEVCAQFVCPMKDTSNSCM